MTPTESAIARNRAEKAKRLARYIIAGTAKVAAQLTPEEWENTAAKADENAPSPETVAEIIRILGEIAI